MNIAALMGTSGTQGDLTGQSKQAMAGADGEFKQALQVLMAGIDEQQLPDGIAVNGNQKENWLGALLKLFDQGSAPQVMPDTAEKTAQVAPEAAKFSLTEIMRTFQTLINQNDAEMLLDGGVAGEQSTTGAATEETAASEIDPASLASQSQVMSPVSITTRQTRPDLSPTSINSPVTNPLAATSSTTVSNGTVPAATNPDAVFVDEAAVNQAKSQANGTAQANHGSGTDGAKATATTAGAATQSAMPATGNQNANAMPESSTSSFSTTPLSTTSPADTQTVAQRAAAQMPDAEALANAAKQSEAMAETMKATSSPEPAPAAKGSSGDTAEAASPFSSTTVSHSSANVAPARVAGNAAASLPDVPVSSQIMDSIKLIMQQDETQVRMQLYPKELGQVLVQLHINEGRVSVNMLAENTQAQSLIQSQLPQLKEALTAQGLQIHEANINVGSDTSAFDTPQQRSRDANFNGRGYQQGNPAMFDEGAPVSTHGSSRTPGSLYAVDYQV